MEAGDEVKNALLKIVQALNRVQEIPPPPELPQPSTLTQPAHLPTTKNVSHDDAQVPRVQPKIRQWTKGAEPFVKKRYNLRPSSYKHRAAKFLLAQHLFNKQTAMHVYNINGRRETINY